MKISAPLSTDTQGAFFARRAAGLSSPCGTANRLSSNKDRLTATLSTDLGSRLCGGLFSLRAGAVSSPRSSKTTRLRRCRAALPGYSLDRGPSHPAARARHMTCSTTSTARRLSVPCGHGGRPWPHTWCCWPSCCTVVAGRKRGTVWLRASQYVVPVGGFGAAIDDLTLLGQTVLLVELVVVAVQVGNAGGDYYTLCVLPWSIANAVPRIHSCEAIYNFCDPNHSLNEDFGLLSIGTEAPMVSTPINRRYGGHARIAEWQREAKIHDLLKLADECFGLAKNDGESGGPTRAH
jgi:hypothetical protein